MFDENQIIPKAVAERTKGCSICRGICTSNHEDIPRYLRPECRDMDLRASAERVSGAIKSTKKAA
jgi:hypothetical protein